MLKWIFERCDGKVHAEETPIGRLPDACRSRYQGPEHSQALTSTKLLSVDIDGWLAEVPLIKEHFAKFGDRLPKGLQDEVAGLEQRLKSAKQ